MQWSALLLLGVTLWDLKPAVLFEDAWKRIRLLPAAEQRQEVVAVLREWAEVDPSTALARLPQLEPYTRIAGLQAVIPQLPQKDLKQAYDLYRQLPVNEQSLSAGFALAARAHALNDPLAREMFYAAYREWQQRAREPWAPNLVPQVLRLAHSLSKGIYDQLLTQIAQWEEYEEKPDTLQEEVAQAIAETLGPTYADYAPRNPYRTVDRIRRRFPQTRIQDALLSYVARKQAKDPELADIFASSIRDPKRREQTYRAILRTAARTDPYRADAFLRHLPVALQVEGVRQVAEVLADKDPDYARVRLQQLFDFLYDRDLWGNFSLLEDLVRTAFRVDPQFGLQLAVRLPDPLRQAMLILEGARALKARGYYQLADGYAQLRWNFLSDPQQWRAQWQLLPRVAYLYLPFGRPYALHYLELLLKDPGFQALQPTPEGWKYLILVDPVQSATLWSRRSPNAPLKDILTAVAEEDPIAAVDFAEYIQEPTLRWDIRLTAVENLLTRDPGSARAYLDAWIPEVSQIPRPRQLARYARLVAQVL